MRREAAIFFSAAWRAARRPRLSPPVNVSNGLGIVSAGSAPVPHMTVDPSGGVDIVWGQSAAYFARTANGDSFATTLLSNSAVASASPRIAVNSAGTVYVVWEDAATCPAITFARSINEGGSFTTYPVADQLTVSGTPETGCAPDAQIAVGANNTVHLLWANESPVQDLIVTYQTDSGGSSFPGFSQAAEQGFQNLSSTLSFTPQMAIDASGDINVAWMGDFQTNGAPEVVYFNRSTTGGTEGSFSNPQALSAPPASGAKTTGFPQIVAEPGGAIDVIWQQASAANPSGAYDIVLARSTDGLTFKPFTLDSTPTTAANTGQIAADASGHVYVAWEGSSGSGGDILINGDSAGITTPPPFSLSGLTASISPVSAVINVGGSASFTMSLNSTNSVSGSVGLGCGAPAGLSCTFSPNPVNVPANGSASVTLTISVSAQPSAAAAQKSPGGLAGSRPGAAESTMAERAWGIGFAVFLILLIAARHEDSRLAPFARAAAWSLVLAAAVTVMVSCGGSTSSGTSGGGGGSMTVPVVVQAQSNSATTNLQTITITVP